MINILNDFISLMGGTYKCSMYLMKSPIQVWSGAAPMKWYGKISRALMN